MKHFSSIAALIISRLTRDWNLLIADLSHNFKEIM